MCGICNIFGGRGSRSNGCPTVRRVTPCTRRHLENDVDALFGGSGCDCCGCGCNCCRDNHDCRERETHDGDFSCDCR